jgi:hypothetical protein
MRLLLGLLLSSISVFSYAQQDLMLFALEDVAQRQYLNPAMVNTQGIHIGLPFLSSVSAQHRNNFLNPGALFKLNEGNVEFQTEEYLSRVEGDNSFGLDLAVDIFSIGVPVGNQYFSFAVRDRLSIDISLSEDLLKFPILGNASFDINGGTLDLSDTRLDLNHYTEYAVGWQTMIREKLSVGLRAKLLFGKESLNSTNNSFTWQTDPEDYTFSFSGDIDLNSSGLSAQFDTIDGNTLLENGKLTQYMLSSKNVGFGFDLGAHLQINSRLDLGISMADIGVITYSQDNRNYTGIGQEIAFAGIEITEAFITENGSFTDSLDAAIATLSESLQESFTVGQNTDKFRTQLRSKAYATVGYRLLKRAKSSAKGTMIMYADVRDGVIGTPTVSFNYAHTWFERVTLAASYSIIEKDRKNVGLACSVKGGPIIFYLAFDNILWANTSSLRFPEATESIDYPTFSQNSALHFGINMRLNQKDKSAKAKGRLDRGSQL